MRRFDPAMPSPVLRFSGVRVREQIVDTNPLPITFITAISSRGSSGGGKPISHKSGFETSLIISRDVEACLFRETWLSMAQLRKETTHPITSVSVICEMQWGNLCATAAGGM